MSKGLTLLASRLEEAEQQAAMALAKAQQDLKLFMDQQNALNQYRQISPPAVDGARSAGDQPQQNSQYHAFINKLRKRGTQQYQGCCKVREGTAVPHPRLEAQQRRARTVELLLKNRTGCIEAQRQESRKCWMTTPSCVVITNLACNLLSSVMRGRWAKPLTARATVTESSSGSQHDTDPEGYLPRRLLPMAAPG